MKTMHHAITLLACTLLVGCAYGNARLDSARDPAFTGQTYQRICVVAEGADTELDLAIEQAFRKELEQQGVIAFLGTEALPDARTHTRAEERAAIARNGIDAVLDLRPTAQPLDPKQALSASRRWPNPFGPAPEDAQEAPTAPAFPSAVSEGEHTWLRFQAALYDTSSSAPGATWVSSLSAVGAGSAGPEAIAGTLATTLVARMAHDHLFSLPTRAAL